MADPIGFFITAIAISLSGVMAPGPITAATLASGTQHRHAGALVALGHAIVEVPFIALLVVGVAGFLESSAVRTGIAIAGGAVLLLMGLQLLLSLRKPTGDSEASVQRHPLMTGIVLTAANPYFLLWWATVGLALVTQALALGAFVLVLFVVVHWLCDLGWLEVLSAAGYKGSELYGRRAQLAISAVCGVLLVGFGVKLLYDAGFRVI
ncbi:MAG: LysE family transporter [Thermoguttaceae bacterium]|jgi:threonine/homoserine/homoserine lactone efflux protein|nr:LysE family transporter [Thermoguttaceae bacterium]